eukprot:696492_1
MFTSQPPTYESVALIMAIDESERSLSSTFSKNNIQPPEYESVALTMRMEEQEINRERTECLIFGYTRNLCAQDDIIEVIYDYLCTDKMQIGKYITFEEYFAETSVHVDPITILDHEDEWPKYLLDQRKKNIQQSSICIVIMILILSGICIGSYYSLRDGYTGLFVFILLPMFCLCGLSTSQQIYNTAHQVIQGTSSTHTEYHDGHIQFHGGKSVKLPYGVDCGFIQTRISQILDNVNQSVIWTVTDLQQ